jgi:hypothetical protein
VSRPSLDWSDPEAVSKWLAGLRLSFGDADAVTRDMLRPLRQRELGRILHRTNYREARERIVTLLNYATSPAPDDPEGGDPAGCGASPAH